VLDPQLKDKVILVTGANNPHGVGAAVARAFAAQGARIFLHYFKQSGPPAAIAEIAALTSPGPPFYWSQQMKSADEVLNAVRSLGVSAYALEADLSDAAVITSIFDEAEKTVGPVEVLVNNAAHWEGDTFLPPRAELANKLDELWADRPQSIKASSFDRLFSVNVRAAALMMAEFGRRHIERGARWGRVINVSTAGAERFPSEISYGASKCALESYTRSAAVELGRFGVTVNVVSLGPVQTGWITHELEKGLLPSIPLGRIGVPEDVADVIVFLASNQARWVTGQRIFVGGGREM
jgi:3-oxoacyl-[acyl-carrier protein] reductase